jgi:hypothetical protein
MPTRHGTSRTALGWTCACTSRTTRADLASPTTPSPDARPRTRRAPGSLPFWAPLPALLRVPFLGTFVCPAGNRSGCRATPNEQVWLPGNALQDPATWMPPPLCQLKQVHEDLLQHYDCTDQPAAAQPAPPSAGGSAAAICRRKPAASARRLPGQRPS